LSLAIEQPRGARCGLDALKRRGLVDFRLLRALRMAAPRSGLDETASQCARTKVAQDGNPLYREPDRALRESQGRQGGALRGSKGRLPGLLRGSDNLFMSARLKVLGRVYPDLFTLRQSFPSPSCNENTAKRGAITPRPEILRTVWCPSMKSTASCLSRC